MKRLFLLILVIAWNVSCASIHEGSEGQSKDTKVKISADRNWDLSDKYYLFYELTLENTTSEWQDMQVTKVQFEGQETEILHGDKLASWIEGAELKLKAANYNKDLLLGSMMVVGAAAAGVSKNSTVQTTGVLVASAGAVGATASGIGKARDQAVSGVKGLNGTVNVPNTHILVPTKIAPESYVRRWIVMAAPKPPAKLEKNSERKVFYEQNK